jgi:hypothetical protein
MTLTDKHRATVEAVLKNRDILKDEQAVLANAAPLLKATILEQREEIDNLRQALTSSVRHVEMFSKQIDERDAEIAALKAKYIPRPMSEAPKDGTWIISLYEVDYYGTKLIEAMHLRYINENWCCADDFDHPEADFTGFLPADTFKGGDDE